MTDIKRITWLRVIVVLAFIFGIFVAGNLWIADRLYPLDPAIGFFSLIPSWLDYVLLPLLFIFLSLAAFSSRPRKYIFISLAIIAFLFSEDRQRLFPSFYEYSLFLLALAFYRGKETAEGASRSILNACRLMLVFIYFWGGILKINPFFRDQISWVMLPASNVLPFIRGPVLNWVSIIAPLIEIEIGLALIFRKTRDFALIEALMMHGLLFFLIGPLRGNWNDSAWAWNLASFFFVYILFFRTNDVGAKEITWNGEFFLRPIIIILFGILPALNLVNAWDSALSFNVYSGNVASAKIDIASSASTKLPQEIQKYVSDGLGAARGYRSFSFYKWSADEFNAEPYPEPRIFKGLTKYLCAYASEPTDIQLTIRQKLAFWEQPGQDGRLRSYNCAEL